jgi:hypothetical protein
MQQKRFLSKIAKNIQIKINTLKWASCNEWIHLEFFEMQSTQAEILEIGLCITG